MGGVPIRPEDTSTSLDSKPRQVTETPKAAPRVGTGHAQIQKPSVGKKVLAEFLEQDANDIKQYVWKDVMIPTIKETLCNIVELLLFGSTSRGRRSSNRGGNDNRTSYSSYYYYGSGNDDKRYSSREDRGSRPSGLNDILFRGVDDPNAPPDIRQAGIEAHDAKDGIEEWLAQYGVLTIDAMYDICNIKRQYSDHTDIKWGWREGAVFETRRVRDGYVLVLPKPTLLD